MTSCIFQNIQNDHDFSLDKKEKKLKKLIIPKDFFIPQKNEKYQIPYEDKDLEKENYTIFPPI